MSSAQSGKRKHSTSTPETSDAEPRQRKRNNPRPTPNADGATSISDELTTTAPTELSDISQGDGDLDIAGVQGEIDMQTSEVRDDDLFAYGASTKEKGKSASRLNEEDGEGAESDDGDLDKPVRKTASTPKTTSTQTPSAPYRTLPTAPFKTPSRSTGSADVDAEEEAAALMQRSVTALESEERTLSKDIKDVFKKGNGNWNQPPLKSIITLDQRLDFLINRFATYCSIVFKGSSAEKPDGKYAGLSPKEQVKKLEGVANRLFDEVKDRKYA